MKSMLGVGVVAVVLLVLGQTVLADTVGQKFSQTDQFRQYVARQQELEDKIARLDVEIAAARTTLEKEEAAFWPRFLGYGLSEFALSGIALLGKTTLFICMAASLLSMILYVVYLVRRNPLKWKLMTSAKTFGLLRDKLLRRNGLLGLVLLPALLWPCPARAGTNVLQDLKMLYSGNQFELGYLKCKYDKGKIDLGYAEVGGVAVLARPADGFERDYDLLAHLQGLGKEVTAEELVSLYAAARSDQQRRLVLALLAKTSKELAREAARRIIDTLCAPGGQGFESSVARFKDLLAAFADSDNRLLANGLVREFLEKGVGRVRDLAGLDEVVALAADNGAFEIIREATAGALKTLPSRLPFAESVYAARIFFKIDKDVARSYFNSIRFDFREFLKSETLTGKLMELLRELSGVAAFLPLYENDALYGALQKQSNDVRVAITGLFDKVDPALAAVAYNSIGLEPRELVFRNPETLILLAILTDKYKHGKTADFLAALERAVVEYDVPYTKAALVEVVGKLGERVPTFIEGVLTHDMNSDCRYNRNPALLLDLIADLAPEQIRAFESYFVKKASLTMGILNIIRDKDKNAFMRVLEQVFIEAPQRLENASFPNDIMDLTTIAPAFSKQALASMDTLPAEIFVAHHQLAGPKPDLRLVRRALIPLLNALFTGFLESEKKELSEKQALAALVLQTLVDRQPATFSDEVFVLDKLVTGYFNENRHAELSARLADREKIHAGLRDDLDELSSRRLLRRAVDLYGLLLTLYLCAGAAFSLLYACNALVPGCNFSMLNGLLHFGESVSTFVMATLVFFPAGFVGIVSAQILRGVIARDTVTPDLRTCVENHDRGYRTAPVPELEPGPQSAASGASGETAGVISAG